MGTTFIWILLALFAYQLYVTVRILLASEYSKLQKLLQILLVWGLPGISALFCNAFLSSDRAAPKPSDRQFTLDVGNSPEGIGNHGCIESVTSTKSVNATFPSPYHYA